MAYSIDALLAEARKHVGYLEKKTPAKPAIFDKTANAGNKNYNMFALYFDEEQPGWQNGRKNTEWCGWCAVYVAYCFCQVFGPKAAQQLLCIPALGKSNYSASPGMMVNYFKRENRWFTPGMTTPRKGDVILFKNAKGETAHVGIVTGCRDGRVYTIEGNTSRVAGMDANGGCCREKSYALKYDRIEGYGRPDYGEEPTSDDMPVEPENAPTAGERTLRKGDKGEDVRTLQRKLIGLGYDLPKYGADGDFGAETEMAVKAFQNALGLTVDGIVGPKTWAALDSATQPHPTLRKGDRGEDVRTMQNLLQAAGCRLPKYGADGDFGGETEGAVKDFQDDRGLVADGIVGPQTWAALDAVQKG